MSVSSTKISTHSAGRALPPTILAILSAVVLLAGCGGDKGPSKADFVKNANAVCSRHYVVISAAASKALAGGKLPSPQAFGKLAVMTIIPQISAQISELRKVAPPDDSKQAYKTWLATSDEVRSQITADPSRIANAKNFTSVNRQADALGLSRECHVGPS